MKRAFSTDTPELMDVVKDGTDELEKNLDDLESLNARFGGHEIVQRFLPLWLRPREPGEEKYRIVDLATASGDIPRMIVDWARERKIAVEIDAVDFNAATLAIARRRSVSYPEINYIEADMLNFDTDGARYDIAICSQALHHFSEEDAVRVLETCRKLSRKHVLVADLTRRWTGRIAVWLLTAAVYRRPMMKYDSRLSVRRAFTCAEFCELARRAGWGQYEHRRFFPVRQAIWMHDVAGSRNKPVFHASNL